MNNVVVVAVVENRGYLGKFAVWRRFSDSVKTLSGGLEYCSQVKPRGAAARPTTA